MADERPISIDRYIQLSSDKELDKDVLLDWLHAARRNAPSGVVTTTQATDPKGRPQSVVMVDRTVGDRHAYVIPLTRDLSDDEVAKIVHAFAAKQPDLDFDIETNVTTIAPVERATLGLDDGRHVSFCMGLAKKRHEDWMRERADAGWRYGPSFSPRAKTHPLMRPWDQMPDRFRVPDLDWPEKMIHLLDQEGYAVVGKDELRALMNLLRGADG